MSVRRSCVSLFACVLALVVCAQVRAQDGTEQAGPASPALEAAPAEADAAALTARYDALVREAIAAQAAGNFEGAHALFEQAHALTPNARTLRGMAVASFQARQFARAIAELDAALVHPEKPLDAELREAVEDLRRRATAEVGTWILRVEPESAQISVDDGAPVPSQEPLVLDPGQHRLRLSAEGYVEQNIEISVMPGTRGPMSLRLQPITRVDVDAEPPQPVVALRPAPIVPMAERPNRRPHRLRLIGTFSLLGLAGAAGMTSAGLYLGGKRRIDDIDEKCRNQSSGSCTPAQFARAESQANLQRFERGINASLGIAGAALAGAGALLTWDYFDNGRRLDLRLSTHAISLHGRF